MSKNKDEFTKKAIDNSKDILEDTLLDKEALLENTRGFSYEDIVQISTKDKVSKIPWLIAIFLIFVISLTVGYMFFRYNPQTLFTNATDKFFTFINDQISENSYDITKGKIDIDFSNGVDNINTKIKYTIDGANNLSRFILDNKVDVYSDGKYIYIKDKDIYDGYLKFTSSSSLKKIKPTDIKNILTSFNQAFDKVSTTEKITGGKTNYDLGNKTIRVYESKLLIEENNYKKAVDTFINSLKTDETFINSMTKILDKDAKEEIDNFSLMLKNYLKGNTLEIKIYTDMSNNDFIKCEVKDKKGSTVITKDDSFNISLDTEFLKGNLKIDLKDKLKIDFDLKEIGKGKITLTSSEADSFGKINMDKVTDYSSLSDEEKLNITSKILGNPYYQKFNIVKENT